MTSHDSMIASTTSTPDRTRDVRLGRILLASSFALAGLACGAGPSANVTTTSSTRSSLLGSAADYRVLGASTVTNTGATVIDGDLGLAPGTAVTGFPPGLITGASNIADDAATAAQVDLGLAIVDLQGLPCDVTLDDAELAGLTLTPGVTCFTSPAVGLSGALTLDAAGDEDAQFIFQIQSTLTTSNAASVVLTGGGSPCNIFWQVGSSATLGTGTRFLGNVLASVSVTATTGATVIGSLLAHSGAVTLDTNTIVGCEAIPGEGTGEGEGEGEGSPVSGEGEGEEEVTSDDDAHEDADLDDETDGDGEPCPPPEEV